MLTDKQVDSARTYNQGQSFTVGQIKVIQIVIGAKQTGVFNEETIKKVFTYQLKNDIPADGKIWRNDRGDTWPVISSDMQHIAVTPTNDLVFGVWVDDSYKKVSTDKYLTKLKDLGITRLAIMVNKMNVSNKGPLWKLRWSIDKFIKFAKKAKKYDFSLVLTCWPRPDIHQINCMLEDIEEFAKVENVHAIEYDAEGNWKGRHLVGFHSMVEAGIYLADKTRRLNHLTNTNFEVTTFPNHIENSRRATLACFADTLLVQAYSVAHRKRSGKNWSVPLTHRYGPGKMQEWAMGMATHVPGLRKSIGCGLAVYDQRFSQCGPSNAVERAILAAISCGADEIRFWSSKWIIGARRSIYMESFLKEFLKGLVE
jgi:hypothetical protein